MKRALALLEQSKNTMPHLPRPTSKDDPEKLNSDLANTYSKREKRLPSANKLRNNDKLITGNPNVATDISSRKSTAVSSTSRIGSSGNNKNKRNSTTQIAGELEEQNQQLYELSLKNNKKAKPMRLKPLPSAKMQTTSLLDIENAYQKQMFQEIESDLTDYLDTNQILSQMQTAFGNQPTSSQSLVSMSSTTTTTKSKKLKQGLEPIMEEKLIGGQIVPYQPSEQIAEIRAKKNQMLKKQVKQLTQGSSADVQANDDEKETFMTACNAKPVPNEDEAMLKEYDELMKQDPNFGKKKKYYKYPEDELLDDLDQHERDMNEMLKYLSEVEDLIKGQDLKSIQQMMDVTKDTMTQHFQAYDKFKDQLLEINNEADAAINVLNYNLDDGQTKKKPLKTQLEKVLEEESKDERNAKQKASQEESKSDIVNSLLNMNSNIREFSRDMETRLDKVYKSGAGKKYGYDSITNLNQNDTEENKREDRTLSKMQSQAQQYLEQNGGMINPASMIKTGKPKRTGTGQQKALPSSLPAAMQRKGSFKKNTKNEDINNI